MNQIFNNKYSITKIKIFSLIVLNVFLFYLIILTFYKRKKKRVGIVGVRHETNIGNNLIKYAMSIKLTELGYIPFIIGTVWERFNNIEFIKQKTNLVIIKNNFKEIKPNDYDILIVNSDQTWRKFDNNFYD